MKGFLHILLTCLILYTGYAPLWAQSKPILIDGIVMDEDTHHPVENATIRLYSLPDSIYMKGTVSNAAGKFTISVVTGSYLLKVSYTGLMPEYRKVKPSHSSDVHVGEIRLRPDVIVLDETLVTAQAPPVVISGDTTIYNASAFPVPEGSMLEELVKQLPGADIDEEGKLTINGQTITKIIMDGEEFFMNNINALKDLPAEIVEGLKTYKRQTDMAALTGIDDGDGSIVLDLVIKPGMKKGWNGNFEGGYGNDDRYEGRANINRFNKADNVSATANMNDNGIQAVKRTGVNYSHTSKKIKYGGGVDYQRNERHTWSRRSTEEFMDNSTSQFSQQNSNSDSRTNRFSTSLCLDWKVNSRTSLIFRPSVSYSNNHSSSESGSETQDDGYTPINRKEASDGQKAKDFSTNGTLTVNRQFARKGRNFTLIVDYDLTNNHSDRNSVSRTSYFKYGDSAKVQNQWIDGANNSHRYRVQLSYLEPVFTNRFLEIKYSYRNNTSRSERYAYNWDELNNDYYQYPDTAHSNCYENINSIHTAGISFRTVRPSYFYLVGINLEAQQTDNRSYVQDSTIKRQSRNVLNYAPNVTFRYNFTKQTTLNVNYRGRSVQPSINDLQPVKDISDPLNIRTGNPDLKSTFNNSIMTTFRTYLPAHFTSLNIGLTYSNTLNSITRIVTYDEMTGVRTTLPVNVNGNWRLNGSVTLTSSFGKKKNFRVSSFLTHSYSNTIGYTVVDKKKSAVRSNTTNLRLSERLKMNYRTKIYDFGISTSVRYGKSTHSINSDKRRETFDYEIGGNANFNLPWNIKLSIEVDSRVRRGYGGKSDYTRTTWDAQISKQLLKKKRMTVRLNFYDILRQNEDFRRSISENTITDSETNTSTIYFMAHLAYSFSSFGTKKKRTNTVNK